MVDFRGMDLNHLRRADFDGCQITTKDVNFVDSMDLASVRIRCLDQGWGVYLVALEAAATSGTPRGPVLHCLGSQSLLSFLLPNSSLF